MGTVWTDLWNISISLHLQETITQKKDWQFQFTTVSYYKVTFEISVLVYIYKTPLPRKKIDNSSLLLSVTTKLLNLFMPPCPSKMSKLLHTFQSWLISLIFLLFIIAQKVKLFGMYHSYWESSCNRHVGWKFFCFTWESIKILTSEMKFYHRPTVIQSLK